MTRPVLFLCIVGSLACSGASPSAPPPAAESFSASDGTGGQTRREANPEAASPNETTVDSRLAHTPVPSPAPTSPPDPGPSDPTPLDRGPIDHASVQCAWGRTRHALGPSFTDPGRPELEQRWRASRRIRGAQLRMSPGELLRLERVVRNTSAEPVVVTHTWREELLARDVWLGPGNPELPLLEVHTPSVVEAGHRLAPGGSLRVCIELRVPDVRLDAFAGQERDALFRLPRVMVTARYPRERGALTEASSWGRLVRLRLTESASLLELCRQETLRAGMGNVQLHGNPYPEAVWVQVPRDRSVAWAVQRLRQRPEVLEAVALSQGDPGTEGCGPYSPCGEGEVCCYMCGIAGCPNTCFAGPACPMGIP